MINRKVTIFKNGMMKAFLKAIDRRNLQIRSGTVIEHKIILYLSVIYAF